MAMAAETVVIRNVDVYPVTGPEMKGVSIVLQDGKIGEIGAKILPPKGARIIEGKGLRDQAQEFERLGCEILGISFDAPEANRAFREKFDFPFRLLSDVSEQVGVAYETRAPGTEKVSFAKRYSYLIDPGGIIAKSYEVTDVNAHAETVLTDLRELQAR